MPDYIAELRRELQARLRAINVELKNVEPLLAEKAQIEQALQREPFADGQGARRRTTRRSRAGEQRAPRGENRRKALEVIEQRPGVSHAELASATGIVRPVLYGVIRGLIKAGEVERLEQPGGGTGYRLRREAGEASDAAGQKRSEPAAAGEAEIARQG